MIYSIVVSDESAQRANGKRGTAVSRIRELGHVPAMVLATPAPTEAEEHDAIVSGDQTKWNRYFVNTVYQAEMTHSDLDEDPGDDE